AQMTAPIQLGPADSDILRRSQRPDLGAPPAPPPPPAGAPTQLAPGGGLGSLVQPDGRIVVTPELCGQAPIAPLPAPDVAYPPRADVYGRPVAPADLPNAQPTYGGIGANTSTDLLIRPQTRVPTDRGGVFGETYVGRVTVDGAGHVTLNGQPLDPAAQG